MARHTRASEKTGVEVLRGLFALTVGWVARGRMMEGWRFTVVEKKMGCLRRLGLFEHRL